MLDQVGQSLKAHEAQAWQRQVDAICCVQRVSHGTEVRFSGGHDAPSTFAADLAFGNRSEKLLVAEVWVQHRVYTNKLIAQVWCARGYIYSIEYVFIFDRSCFFAKNALKELLAELACSCELRAGLS